MQIGSKGTVYILDNLAMPGLVKVGRTNGSAEERARKLSHSTGVPMPFRVVHQRQVWNPKQIEPLLHRRLTRYRVHDDREFLRLPVEDAIDIMDRVCDAHGADLFENPRSRPRPRQASRDAFGPPANRAVDSACEALKRAGGRPVRLRAGKRMSKRRERSSFTTVRSYDATCPRCGCQYSVTLRRYEDQVACLECNTIDKANVRWS